MTLQATRCTPYHFNCLNVYRQCFWTLKGDQMPYKVETTSIPLQMLAFYRPTGNFFWEFQNFIQHFTCKSNNFNVCLVCGLGRLICIVQYMERLSNKSFSPETTGSVCSPDLTNGARSPWLGSIMVHRVPG